MSIKQEGFIAKISTKEGSGQRGPWALDNLLLQDENGEDIGWFGLGFRDNANTPPKCQEGDYIRFEYEVVKKGQYENNNIVKGSAKIVKKDVPESAPAASAAPTSAGAAKVSTQQNIHYQSSRTAAIELVGILLENDALPHSSVKTKAGQAKAFDEIKASVDKLTVQFFNDLESFRLFDTVADAGDIDVGADGDLPDAEPASPSGDEDEPL